MPGVEGSLCEGHVVLTHIWAPPLSNNFVPKQEMHFMDQQLVFVASDEMDVDLNSSSRQLWQGGGRCS